MKPKAWHRNSFQRVRYCYIEQKRDEEPKPIELDQDSGRARDIPLVVLVNETSASAAEIVAASLRDNGRAEVVGVNTFGTATVVSSFDLDDGSIAAIGTAVWTTPNGENARNVGIEPTVFVDLPPQAQEVQFDNGASLSLAQIEEVEDMQLLEAMNILIWRRRSRIRDECVSMASQGLTEMPWIRRGSLLIRLAFIRLAM